MKPDEWADNIVLNYPEASRARKSISEAIRIAVADERDKCAKVADENLCDKCCGKKIREGTP